MKRNQSFNPYFTGLPILIAVSLAIKNTIDCFNPYFTGLPILILQDFSDRKNEFKVSILILLDYLFLFERKFREVGKGKGFNPYFTGLPILIANLYLLLVSSSLSSFNPYFTGLPILITWNSKELFIWACFNPYFTGLPILINIWYSVNKIEDIVSILILLDYLFLSEEDYYNQYEEDEFQSLFYWITYSYYNNSKSTNWIYLVSILILLDYLFL